jgi:hypothetical protein
MAYPNNTQPISFAQLNVELGHSSGATLSLGQAAFEEFAQATGTTIEICEFYSDGCPDDHTYPWDVQAIQGDIIGEQVGVYWEHAGALGFTLQSYTIWQKVDSGSWSASHTGISSSATYFSDSTQPGFTHYYRVQAIGSSLKSPIDGDMTNTGTVYPPTGVVTTEDETPTTT